MDPTEPWSEAKLCEKGSESDCDLQRRASAEAMHFLQVHFFPMEITVGVQSDEHLYIKLNPFWNGSNKHSFCLDGSNT